MVDARGHITADTGSGAVALHVVGYRRGDGHIRIDVDTGSGSLVLEPAALR